MTCPCPCHPRSLSLCPECYPTHGVTLRQWKNLYETRWQEVDKAAYLKLLKTKRKSLQAELKFVEKEISKLVQ